MHAASRGALREAMVCPYRFNVHSTENTFHSLISRAYTQDLLAFKNTKIHSETTERKKQKEREENNVLYKHNIFSRLDFHFTSLQLT